MLGPFLHDEPNPETSATFLFLNAGKRSVTIDTTTEAGRRQLKELARGQDALIISGSPAEVEGLDLLDLADTSVITLVTPFGMEGPYREWQATELIWQAMGGLMHITGNDDREPLKNPGIQISYVSGYHIYAATLAALYARLGSGAGQIVDMSVMECAVHTLEATFMRWHYQGEQRRRGGTFRSPVYPAGDGYVSVSMGLGGARRRAFAEMLGEPVLLEERFMSHAARADLWDEIDVYLIPWLFEHDKEWIVQEAQQRGIPFGAARTSTDLLANRQLESRGFFRTVNHPVVGPLRYPGPPYDASAIPWTSGRSPLLGEHNDELAPVEGTERREAS